MKKLFKHGLLPLSADPITYGHIRLIERAMKICHEVTVFIAINDLKRDYYTFTEEERVAMVRKVVDDNDWINVYIVSGSDLLVDVYLAEGCDVLVRGVRNDKDREYEEEQVAYHGLLYPPISTQVKYIQAEEHYEHISSSIAKAFVCHGVDASAMVPLCSKAMLEERLLHRTYVGVTGCIASGKSTLTKALVNAATKRGIDAVHIDIDQVSKTAIFEQSRGASLLRSEICSLAGDPKLFSGAYEEVLIRFRTWLMHPNTTVGHRAHVHRMVEPHIARLTRKIISQREGFVFIEWAQLIEMNMLSTVNNTVVVVKTDDQEEFARKRALDGKWLKQVQQLQWDADRKIECARKAKEDTGYGQIVVAENKQSTSNDMLRLAEKTLNSLLSATVRDRGCVP